MALSDLQKFGILRLFWKGCLKTKCPHCNSTQNTCFLLVNLAAITLAMRSTRGCSGQNLYRTSVQSVRALDSDEPNLDSSKRYYEILTPMTKQQIRS